MTGLDTWYSSGQRVPLVLPDQSRHNVFCRVDGNGPWLTLLHGFPTCSWDWAHIADGLALHYRLLMPDLLGFGESAKPTGHQYSLVEQADLVEALWRHYDIRETGVVAHDIGGSIVLELLGRPTTHMSRVVFLNSALYANVSRPRLAQRLLANKVVGPLLARMMTERLFSRNLSAVFSAGHPLSPTIAAAYWSLLRRGSSPDHIHRLLQYIPERQRHRQRWEEALERTTVPLHFIWGMQDPISGAAMADHIRARLPSARLVECSEAGHYPQVEVPEKVQSALSAVL